MNSDDKIIKAPAGFTEAVLKKTTRRRRGFSVSPSWQLVAACFLLAMGFVLGTWRTRLGEGSSVVFRLDAPRASSVALAGDFTGWEMKPLRREGDSWALSLEVPPGRHQYIFILNGKRMVLDPAQDQVESDPQGGAYSVLDLRKASPL